MERGGEWHALLEGIEHTGLVWPCPLQNERASGIGDEVNRPGLRRRPDETLGIALPTSRAHSDTRLILDRLHEVGDRQRVTALDDQHPVRFPDDRHGERGATW